MYFPPTISQEPRGSMRIHRERHPHPSHVREYADHMVNFFSNPKSPTATSPIIESQQEMDTGKALRQPLDSPSSDSGQHWSLWQKPHDNEVGRLNKSNIAFDETETGGTVFGMVDTSSTQTTSTIPKDQKVRRPGLPRADEIDTALVDSLFSDT